MNINSRKVFILFPAVMLLMAGCNTDNTGEHHYDNKAYISATQYTDEVLVSSEESSYERSITLGMAKPEEHDVTATVRIAPELLDRYKTAYYDEDIELLPDGVCTVESSDATIVAGNVSSIPVTVKFNTASLDLDKRYVMPVTVDNVEGIDFLESSRTMYFILRGASLVNVVANLSENRAWPTWNNFSQVRDMSTFTFEALVCPDNVDKTISTIMGVEDQFLLRLGDSGISPNQLQIVCPNSLKLTNADMKIPVGEWTHIAVTFDNGQVKAYLNGMLKGETTVTSSSVNFDIPHSDESPVDGTVTRCFWVGYSFESNRYFDGEMSELRIWNRVLSEEDINQEEHFYRVSPDSEGLVAYWKLDDGFGSVAKDYSQYGNDLTIESEPEWIDVALPERD